MIVDSWLGEGEVMLFEEGLAGGPMGGAMGKAFPWWGGWVMVVSKLGALGGR